MDEVLKTKDSFTYNTSSVVAKRCADTFPHWGMLTACHRIASATNQMLFLKRVVVGADPYREENCLPHVHP